MMGLAFAPDVLQRHDAARVLEEVRKLGLPFVAGDDGSDPSGVEFFASLARALSLPAEAIWYATADRDGGEAARTFGFNVVLVTESADEVLEAIREPYTRSLLSLRYIMRTALEWRPGHVIDPEDLEPS